MKTLLWIGSYLTKEKNEELQKLGYRNAASYLSQKNILEGIEAVSGKTFDSVSVIVLTGYPKGKMIYFKEKKFCHKVGAEDTLVGFLNIIYINKLFSQISLRNGVKKWLLKHKGDCSELDVFIYEMRSACLHAASGIKKRLPNSKIHLIVPDLPAFMDLNMNLLKRLLKRLDWRKIVKNLECVDDYILYSEPMVDYLSIRDKKWMVMEGSIDANDVLNSMNKLPELTESTKNIVMYSGSINQRFGIRSLLDAFQYLDDDYELWITGSGPEKELVSDYAWRDERIKYYGFLPSRDDLIALQQQATMMINMRRPDEEASGYCFPSKIFEYMLSEKPVLSCRLRGIPKEYYDYLIEMKSIKSEDIAESIQRVAHMSKSERKKRGRDGIEFILNRKSSTIQAKRILDFVGRTGLNNA